MIRLPYLTKKNKEPELMAPVDAGKKIRRRKTKEVKKPWGREERLLVLIALIATTAISGILTLKSQGKFSLPKISKPSQVLSSFSVKSEDTIIVENKLPKSQIDKVKASIKDVTNNLNGTYGVWSEDLNGSYSLGISEKEQFEGASFFKLPLVVAVYEDSEKGNLNLNDTYMLTDADKMPGAGTLTGLPTGTSISYQDIVQTLLKDSDNTAFNILYNKVGTNKIQEVINEAGMKNTSYEDSLTTPFDMGLLFKKLTKGELVSNKSRDEILNSLTNTDYEDFIPKGTPGVRVAHKIGEEIGTVNDGGIVFASRPFILIIMSKNTSEDEASIAIPKITQIIYTELQ